MQQLLILLLSSVNIQLTQITLETCVFDNVTKCVPVKQKVRNEEEKTRN